MHNSTPELITQEVFLDTFGTAFVDQASDCLGADDGAGVFLMLEMIDANVELCMVSMCALHKIFVFAFLLWFS